MVWCNRKRKICFYWSVAGIITIEACIFFFMLLYFNSENAPYDKRPPLHSATSHDGEEANPIPSTKPTNMGHLMFLPANRASITVDFKKPAEYSQNYMNLVLDEYAEYKRKACIKAPELSLGDCDWTTYYGLDEGFFCLVARLEETRNWIPDDFLQTNWLPQYKDDFLPVSCEIIAQNKSYIDRHGKLHEFYYRKQLTNMWPASGFPKKLFPLGKDPGNCYPPVTIKVDDAFVLNYQHEQISVVCEIWSYNSRTLSAASVSINVTLLHRKEAVKEARKPKHSPTLFESTPTTGVTLPSTKGTPKGTTNIKPIELLPVHFTKSMPRTTFTHARSTSTFTKSSVSTTALPLSSTATTTYMDFTKPSATSHKRSPVTGAAEINSVKPSTRTPSLTEKTSKPTDLILNASLPSLATTREGEYHGETNTGSTKKANFNVILTTTDNNRPEKSNLGDKYQQTFFVEFQNHSSIVETSSVSIPTASAVNNKNESNSSSRIKDLNFTSTLGTSSASLETTLALEASSENTYHALDSTSSTLETASSTFESISSTLKTRPITLETASSTLETTSSKLETSSSTLETTPSTLEVTLALETSSIPLETSSLTVSTSTEIPITIPSFDHPPDGGENSHYSDDD